MRTVGIVVALSAVSPLPSGVQAAPSKVRHTPLVQRPLWLDLDVPPAPALRSLPEGARAIRMRLKDCFDPGRTLPAPFADRTHDLGQQLLPLLRRVSYTQALIEGAFQLALEYRPCDKFPHYRLLWGHLLWGRVDIRMGNTAYGADSLACEALPFVQARLADYLICLGFRLGSARLQGHTFAALESDPIGDVLYAADENTDTREYRMFKVDIERERRQVRIEAARCGVSVPAQPRSPSVGWWTLGDWGGSWPRWRSDRRL